MFSQFGRMALVGLVTVVTCPAFAHPGHGRDGGSHEMTHYLTEPEHIAPLALAVLVGAAAAGAVAWYRRKV